MLVIGIIAGALAIVAGLWWLRGKPADPALPQTQAGSAVPTDSLPAELPKPASSPVETAIQGSEDTAKPTAATPSNAEGEEAGKPAVQAVQGDLSAMFQSELNDLVAESQDELGSDATMPFSLFLVSGVANTDVGRRRRNNEDQYLVLPEAQVFVVADGMGGHAAGEVASRITCEAIEACFRDHKFPGTPDPQRPARGDELVRAIQAANKAVRQRAAEESTYQGMGSTVVSARFSPRKERVYIAHVGDSRCYRIREGEIELVTRDHTLAEMGVSGPMAAKLTRAIGTDDEVEVELKIDVPKPGDHYVLCSDGLSKMLPDEEIAELVLQASDADQACQTLIERANERGGRDNVTVIVLDVKHPLSAALASAQAPS